MPLAVLLPKFGDLAVLPTLSTKLERRLEQLQERSATHSDEKTQSDLVREAEESMIVQVLQWIRIRQR
jgi:hypothetical protein